MVSGARSRGAIGPLATAAILALAATPAAPQPLSPAVPHSIPWFETHHAERQSWIASCRDDHRLAAEKPGRAVCANAEAAESRLYARSSRSRGFRPFRGFEALDTPWFHQSSPGWRAAVRTACVRRASFDRPLLRYCGLAG